MKILIIGLLMVLAPIAGYQEQASAMMQHKEFWDCYESYGYVPDSATWCQEND